MPIDDEDDDACWTDSAIFGISHVAGGDFLDPPCIDIVSASMDESQLRLAASVFSNAHDGIMITNGAGEIVDVNRAFVKTTGFSATEVIGKRANLLNSGIHPPAFYEALWDALKKRGAWRGEIWNRRKNGELFVELLSISAVTDAFGKLTHYVAIYTDVTALRESQQRLEHLAHHDALTNLPNRVLLADRILQGQALVARHGKTMAVCLLDLDRFKPVNDQHGHHAGDRLLLEVSQRLRESLQAGDTVARLGGDEFALLLTDLDGADEAAEILQHLLQRIAEPYTQGEVRLSISASIGYTLVPLDNSDSDSLLRHADQAMYLAKQQGRNQCHLFDTEHDQWVRCQRESVTRIEQALAAGELCLYYQPKVDMRQGKVVGMEALIRWQHPELGLLVPADFLGALDDQELLVDIGDWVIGEAMGQMAAWCAQGIVLPVSVNISGGDLLHADFSHRLQQHLADFPQVAPEMLELEILETTALEDVGEVSRIIDNCRQLGVTCALDDFGTGYSSLLYLKRLPVKTLKIDQSFVCNMLNDPEDMAIIDGVLGLARVFNRRAVAEGVESIEHGILLLRHDCDIAQGYAIARPLPAADVAGWLASFTPDPAWQRSLQQAWEIADFPLLAAASEQRHWLQQMEALVVAGATETPPDLLGHLRDSRLGRWLSGRAMACYGQLPEREEIARWHLKTYRIGAEISVRLARGEVAKAQELLPALRAHSQDFQAALAAMQELIVPA